MYVWVDGIHLKVRLEQDKVCLLVMIGVRADGRKELVALADGFRESTESWADLLRDCRRRGMTAPVLAVGDGALGFWKAVARGVPRHPRAAVLVAQASAMFLPRCRSRRTRARKPRCAEIYNAEDNDHARRPRSRRSRPTTAPSGPRRSRRSPTTLDVLLAFYDYPAEHWIHLRTTNPIESTFATVRLRQRVTKGPGSRAAGVAMAFKLIESAQARWRAVNAPHLVALVRAGARFDNGKLVERPDESGGDQQVA